MNTEYRAAGNIEYDEDRRLVAARIVNYDRVDTYGTQFAPGCFTESLRHKKPISVFGHNPQRPIGKVIDYRESDEGVDVIIKLADPEAVPDARMVHSLLKEEILTEFSIGFSREADEERGTRITKAELVEVSPVLKGSVPGTRTLAVRSTTRAEATELLNRVVAGELDAETALAQLAAQLADVDWPIRAAGDCVPDEDVALEMRALDEIGDWV